MSAKTTESDRSARYQSDFLTRVIEDTIRREKAEVRLYPDLYAEKVADAVRAALIAHLEHEPLPDDITPFPRVKGWFVEGCQWFLGLVEDRHLPDDSVATESDG